MAPEDLTLASFLLARIAEDEAAARGAANAAPAPWESADRGWMASLYCAGSDMRMIVLDQADVPGRKTPGDVLLFIARHDPARVLTECDARRRIVELHAAQPRQDGIPYCLGCASHGCWECDREDSPWPCEILRFLAVPFADHPDFRPEWRA